MKLRVSADIIREIKFRDTFEKFRKVSFIDQMGNATFQSGIIGLSLVKIAGDIESGQI